jgi:hypothetical protein
LKSHVCGTDLTFSSPASSVAAAVSAAPHPKQGLSDLNLNFKKDRQITHNSMFADYLSSSTDSFIRNP